MRFRVREAKPEDQEALFKLSTQFPLLSLSADQKEIEEKIEISRASFRGELEVSKSKYIFVVEDLKNHVTVGCSQIIGKHGTVKRPSYSFEVHKKERFSKELDVGFVHQFLRMKMTTDGPTELGGLILNLDYRRRPEGVGKLLSLIRFVYIGMFREKFEKELYAEMAPPLTEEGRSDFWEALGRRFTGMSYTEADRLSRQDKEFISSLFPEDDIYLCLLDPKARLVMGRVGYQTQRAYYLLRKLGFSYKYEVDPFDGGPHIGILRDEMSIIKKGSTYKLKLNGKFPLTKNGYFGFIRSGSFYGGHAAFHIEGEDLYLSEDVGKAYELSEDDSIYITEA